MDDPRAEALLRGPGSAGNTHSVATVIFYRWTVRDQRGNEAASPVGYIIDNRQGQIPRSPEDNEAPSREWRSWESDCFMLLYYDADLLGRICDYLGPEADGAFRVVAADFNYQPETKPLIYLWASAKDDVFFRTAGINEGLSDPPLNAMYISPQISSRGLGLAGGDLIGHELTHNGMGLRMVDYLVARQGWPAITWLLSEIRKGNGLDQSIEKVFGLGRSVLPPLRLA